MTTASTSNSIGSIASLGTGIRVCAGSATPDIFLGQHPELGHIVIDQEDCELGDLIRLDTERIEGGVQICVGLLNLGSEVG